MSFFFPLVLVCGVSPEFADNNPYFTEGCTIFHGSMTPLTEQACENVVNEAVDNAMNPPAGLGISGQFIAQAICVELPKQDLS